MKKVLIIMLATLAIISCRKKDNGSDTGLGNIIEGKWFITDLEVDVNSPLGPLPTEVNSVTGYYYFKSDKTFDYVTDADMELTIPLQGTIEIPYKVAGKGTYKVVGEEAIELTENGQTSTLGIVNATQNVIVGKTETVIDTMGFELEMEIDIVLEK